MDPNSVISLVVRQMQVSWNCSGDHLFGKRGNVREFNSCQGNVRDFTKSQE